MVRCGTEEPWAIQQKKAGPWRHRRKLPCRRRWCGQRSSARHQLHDLAIAALEIHVRAHYPHVIACRWDGFELIARVPVFGAPGSAVGAAGNVGRQGAACIARVVLPLALTRVYDLPRSSAPISAAVGARAPAGNSVASGGPEAHPARGTSGEHQGLGLHGNCNGFHGDVLRWCGRAASQAARLRRRPNPGRSTRSGSAEGLGLRRRGLLEAHDGRHGGAVAVGVMRGVFAIHG